MNITYEFRRAVEACVRRLLTLGMNNVMITPYGGLAVKLVAGEALTEGQLVIASTTPGQVLIAPADSDMPIGGLRNDILAQYPEYATYPGVTLGGFSIAFNYGNLAAGNHTLKFRAVDNDDAVQESDLINFTVVKFDGQAFIGDPSSVDYSQAGFSTSGPNIFIDGMRVGGAPYDAVLTWQTESQQFQFTAIQPKLD